jgi:hypothetical protein
VKVASNVSPLGHRMSKYRSVNDDEDHNYVTDILKEEAPGTDDHAEAMLVNE